MDDLSSSTERAMLALGGTDNVLLKQAEAYLKVFLNKKAAAATLFTLVQHSPHVLVRQLSGVLLRPKMITFWNRLTPALREQLKAVLISRLAEEPGRGVRKAVVSLIVALGKALLPGGNWPELMGAIQASAKHPSEDVRELGMVLLRDLIEALGEQVGPMAEGLKVVIGEALADAGSRKVRAAALRALGALLRSIEDKRNLSAFKDVLPVMMTVTQQCLEALQEDAVADALGTIQDLVDYDSPILSPHIDPVARFLIAVLGDDRLEDGTRDVAAGSLVRLVEAKPKTFLKKGLVDAALPVIMACMAKYDAEVEREQLLEARVSGVELSDYVDASIWNVAGRVLDGIALALPAKHVFQKVAALAAVAMGSPDATARQAGVMALAICSEGCRDVMSPQLEVLLEAVLRLSRDPDALVREAVLSALCSFAEFVNPRILNFHATVLPAAIAMMTADAGDPWIVQRGCQVIECFVDGLDRDELQPYLPQLLGLLGEQLVRPGQEAYVQEMIVAALASLAVGAGKHIVPYVGGLSAALLPLMEAKDPKLLRLRGHAAECMGYTAVAAGRELCREHLARIMVLVGESFGMESIELKERTFIALEALLEAFGEDLAAYVPALVTVLRENIESTDYLQFEEKVDADHAAIVDAVNRLAGDDDEDGAVGGAAASAVAGEDEDDDDDDDEEEDGMGDVELKVHTSHVEMKATALSCLGFMAKHCPVSFAPFLFDAITLLENHAGAFHVKLRQRALMSLACCVSSMLAVYPPLPPASPAEPATLSAETRAVYDRVMFALTQVLARESDSATVATACVTIQTICKEMGMAAVTMHHAGLMKELLKIGRGRARCQLVNDDGEGGRTHEEEDEDEDGAAALDPAKASAAIAAAAAGAGFGRAGAGAGGHADDDEEDDDHDHELIDEATDAVMQIGKAMRHHFAMYLPDVVKVWSAFTKPSRSYLDKLMAVGLWADLVSGIGATFAPQVAAVMPTVLSAAADPNPELRRNGLFCIGVMLEGCTDACRPFLASMLQAMHPSFVMARGGAREEELALDNAAAALCKAIIAVPEAVPLAAALPPLVNLLPIRADWEETRPVFVCLLGLLAAENAEAMKVLPRILHIAAAALAPESRVPVEVQQGVVAMNLRVLARSASPATQAAFAAAVSSLVEADRSILSAVVAS